MPDSSFEFVHLDADDVREKSSSKDPLKRQVVRSHAMRDYRSRQRREHRDKGDAPADASRKGSQRVPRSQSNSHAFVHGNIGNIDGLAAEMHVGPLELRSPSMQRQQLVTAFMDGIPWMAESCSSHQVAAKLHRWLRPDEPIAVLSQDTLLLAQLASVTGDAHLAMEASKQHVRALRCLRHSLTNAAIARSDGILNAVDALGVCEMFEELSQSPNAWRHHANALALLLYARGPASLDYGKPLTNTLVFNAVHLNLLDALSSRAAFAFGRQPWLHHLEVNCRGRQWCLVHVACQIPALLSRLDKLGALTTPPTSAGKLYKDLTQLDQQLCRWLQAWYLEDLTVRPVNVNVEEFPAFIDIYSSIAGVFPTVHKFDCLDGALGHVSFWLMRLPLLEAIHDLITQTDTVHLATSLERAEIELQLEQCADSICQSAPALIGVNPETSIGLQTMRGVYLWTLAWYTKTKRGAKAQYCQALLNFNTAMVRNVAKGVVTHDKRTVSANAFVARRMLWLESVGSSVCHLKVYLAS